MTNGRKASESRTGPQDHGRKESRAATQDRGRKESRLGAQDRGHASADSSGAVPLEEKGFEEKGFQESLIHESLRKQGNDINYVIVHVKQARGIGGEGMIGATVPDSFVVVQLDGESPGFFAGHCFVS